MRFDWQDKNVPRMTVKERSFLLQQWNLRSVALMTRDGNDGRFPDGGHRIASNPLLIAAIEEIRDGYFMLFNEKRHFRKQALADIPNKYHWGRRQLNAEYDLVIHNAESMQRLQQQDYGFTPEQKAAILRRTHSKTGIINTAPLSEEDAYSIVGAVVRHSIDTFHVAFIHEQIPAMGVPDEASLHPEEEKIQRSTPRERTGWFGASSASKKQR